MTARTQLAVLFLSLLQTVSASAIELVPVPVLDYESDTSLPKVWVVNMPRQNATVKMSADHPHDGKQCLELDYKFTGKGQYLGVANRVRILSPIHTLRFWVRGGTGAGISIYLTDVHDGTHKYRTADPGGAADQWREIVIDLDKPHETWGGDKNGKLDYPILGITFEIANRTDGPAEGKLFFDTVSVESEKSAVETLGVTISVTDPPYCSDVAGNTPVTFSAPGFKRVTAGCWKQGPGFGIRATLATVDLDNKGRGSFVFPADQFPHGPVTVQISGKEGTVTDTCYLQLYNKGGVSWNEGMPKTPPPAAADMRLVFADDFDKPPSIASDGTAVYFDHKPRGGDFSSLPFTGHVEPGDPFLQRDAYLRIRADESKNSAGLISSLNNNGKGIKASVPCYFECRFVGPNAIGTWPAFWLLTDYPSEIAAGKPEKSIPVDELDIIEAYGGEGLGEPNSHEHFCITPHAWNQPKAAQDAAEKAWKDLHSPVSMAKAGVPSAWFETFHTYGCKITDTDTIYYCDDIEIARHKTLEVSKKKPFFFLINLATGGGWPVDLSRYSGRADMYMDYVRVYQGSQ